MGVIACAALTMTSCSNDEIGGNNTKQGDPIEFGVYLGRDAQGSRGTSRTGCEDGASALRVCRGPAPA